MRRQSLKHILTVAIAMIICTSNVAAVPESESWRLVVTAGVLAPQQAFSAFYQSRIFTGDDVAPFYIADADARAFETDEAIFYASSAQSAEAIVSAKTWKSSRTTPLALLVGHSYRGIALNNDGTDDRIRRHLGADSQARTQEMRDRDGITILAVRKSPGAKITWPTSAAQLRRVPAVIITDVDKNSDYVLVARSVGALTHRLGVVDNMLSKKSSAAGWIDVGTSDGISSSMTSMNQLGARRLLAVSAGSIELMHAFEDKNAKQHPFAMPFAGHHKKIITIGAHTINLWTVTHGENAWTLYDRLGKQATLNDALKEMKAEADKIHVDKSKNPSRHLNVVRVYSDAAAEIAARSVYVDLVLVLASDPYAQLPTRETIELKNAETDAYEQIAPVVRISNLDASELHLVTKGSQKIQRVDVVREGFSDDAAHARDVPAATITIDDNAMLTKTDNQPWQRESLQKIIGGMTLAATKADVAIATEMQLLTPIAAGLSVEVAKNIIAPRGNVVTVTISGKQLKRIAKLIGSNKFSRKHVMYGMDPKSLTVGKRVVNDRERFTVALSEEALLDLFGLSRLGGLQEDYAMRAPFVAAVYADSRQLFYIGGQKSIPITDTADELERAVRDIKAGTSYDDIMRNGFAALSPTRAQDYVDGAVGKPHHVITVDINYLDVGISKNVVNDNYTDASGTFPTSRGGIKPYAHVFLFTKMSVNYETPVLHSSLFGEVKYMHTDFKTKPEKDKTKLGLKLRMPWEQTYFKDRAVTVSPIFNNTYETKLAPNFFADNDDIRKKPRVRRIDSLLGVNVDFTKLGFNVDVGAAMATDFNRAYVDDALDFGPGVNFSSRWPLFGPFELSSEVSSVYLFPLPKNNARHKIALGVEGTVWLRVARFYDFGVDAMSDFLVATFQESPQKFILSSIFGLTISYGRLFRLLG